MKNVDKFMPTAGKKIEFYNLEKVRFIIKDGSGLDIDYAYEDLVFSEHGIFIFRFDTKSIQTLSCWFNHDCIDTNRHAIFKSLNKSARLNDMEIIYNGKFEMVQQEEDQIVVNFMDN